MDGMVRRVRGFAAGVLFALAVLPAARAAEPTKMRYFKTQEFEIVYLDERKEYILPHLARCFENSLRFHRRLRLRAGRAGHRPPPGLRRLRLRRHHDDSINYITLGIEPFEYVYETSPPTSASTGSSATSWSTSSRPTRRAGSDRCSARSSSARSGRSPNNRVSMIYSYLTSPRLYAPRWYHEGIAVFLETWMAGGFGRALGGYDEMVFRTMVADHATSTTSSDSSRRGPRSTSRSARTPTSTGRAS